jgi:hypothetical protein
MTKIVHTAPGFDWNHSKLFLITEVKMKNAEEKELPFRQVWDKAKEWATEQAAKNENGYNAEDIYNWVFMYLRDQFKILPKFGK